MFGIGWTEMLLIGVVALIVIGPKDLPVVMNRMGKALASIRRMGSDFQREINKSTGFDQITDLRKSITEPLKQTAAQIRSEFNKPLADGGFTPSGAIKPKDPKAESVVEEIHANLGIAAAKPAEPPQPVVPPAKPKRAKKVESPAPAEAIAPAKPARKPRVKAAAAVAAPASEGPLFDTAAAAAPVKKPAAPRKPRAPKPKPEA
jgi:sec-independent protein translocase protein TatB